MLKRTKCLCGSESVARRAIVDGFHGTKPAKLTLLSCGGCGVVRQDCDGLDYVSEYHSRDWAHSYGEDREAARKRLLAYGLSRGAVLLDVGSNNGAFVDECREQGILAYGVEPGADNFTYKAEHTYRGFLNEVNFPCDYADALTLHDVLEHAEDPVALLREVSRVVKPGGRVLIDIPAFWTAEGRKHWKVGEHIWFFASDQLIALCESAGMGIAETTIPIPGKVTCEFIVSERVYDKAESILVPGGVGDIYWCLAKMRGLREAGVIPSPVPLHIRHWIRPVPAMYGRDDRAAEFIIRSPYVKYLGLSAMTSKRQYVRPEPIQHGFGGHRFYLQMNAGLSPDAHSPRPALSLDEILPDIPVEWRPPLFVSLERRQLFREARALHADKIAVYLQRYHARDRRLARMIARMAYQINALTGNRIVVMGAEWDRGGPMDHLSDPNIFEDLRGKTTFEEAEAIMCGARGVVGVPSGLTIFGAINGARTIMLWNDTFKERFRHTLVPPGSDYLPMGINIATARKVIDFIER